MSSSEAPAVTYTPLADAGSDSNAIETFVVLSTSPPSDRDGRWRRKKARQKEKKRIDSEIAAGTIKEVHPHTHTHTRTRQTYTSTRRSPNCIGPPHMF